MSTVCHYLSGLKLFFVFLISNYWKTIRSTHHCPSKRQTLLQILLPNNMTLLLSQSKKSIWEEKIFKFLCHHDMLIIKWLYNAGMQLNKLFLLRYVNVDFEHCSIKIMQKDNKEHICLIGIYFIQNLTWLTDVTSRIFVQNDFISLNEHGSNLTPRQTEIDWNFTFNKVIWRWKLISQIAPEWCQSHD
jgi:site-specific recombinase XerD